MRLVCVGGATDTGSIGYEEDSLESVLPQKSYVTVAPRDGDFTSILSALKETNNTTDIIIKKGIYNVFDEYTDYYGSSFWDDYPGYINTLDPFYRGLWLESGRRVTGEVGSVIDCVYFGNNKNVTEYFSAFANEGDVFLDGLTIHYGNVRYAIHDDFLPNNQTVELKNLKLTAYSSNTAIGGGLGFGSRYYIDGCVFRSCCDNSGWDINYHSNGQQIVENSCEVYVTNCYGDRGCGFWSNGLSQVKSQVYISNSRFREICSYSIEGFSKSNNIILTEWNNEIDE